ncbi:MAG: hypothetical protein IJ725_06520 [Ruminococcus sp.]|nr:hypothetical protein [Ruminococcus sp.]
MDINVAFKSISDKVEGALAVQGFKKEKVSPSKGEMVSLFTSETVAYSVVYFTDKKHFIMRQCSMTEDGPDNEWRTLATWMLDPETDSMKDADSIANDFVDNCTNASATKRLKTTKKKKKKDADEGSADPLFLSKRFVTFFPELKDEIKQEEDCYYPFRGVTFARASIVPKLQSFVKTANKKDIEKLGSLLSAQYANGDADTRSIITIVILNAMPEEKYEDINANLSDELKNAWKFALKFKGKKVKPEKPKKKKKTMVERLQEKQQ